MGNILFIHDFSSTTGTRAPEIVCYAPPDSLDAKVSLAKHLHLDSSRSVEVSVFSGWNNLAKGELRLRSASAGLRLRTADAEVIDGEVVVTSQRRPGVIEFDKLEPGRMVKFDIPYGLERDLPELSVCLVRNRRGASADMNRSRLKSSTPQKRGNSYIALLPVWQSSCHSASMCKRFSNAKRTSEEAMHPSKAKDPSDCFPDLPYLLQPWFPYGSWAPHSRVPTHVASAPLVRRTVKW